jgi:hypothetical protein
MLGTITVRCHHCPTAKELEVDIANFAAWQRREVLIQVALPNLPPEDRELIKSNMCGECWDRLIKLEEE